MIVFYKAEMRFGICSIFNVSIKVYAEKSRVSGKKIKWTYQAYPLFYTVVDGVLAVKTQPATRNFRLQSVLFDEVFDELERRFVIGTDVVFVRIVYGVVVLVRIAVLVHEEHYRYVLLGERPVVAVFVEFVAV